MLPHMHDWSHKTKLVINKSGEEDKEANYCKLQNIFDFVFRANSPEENEIENTPLSH